MSQFMVCMFDREFMAYIDFFNYLQDCMSIIFITLGIIFIYYL